MTIWCDVKLRSGYPCSYPASFAVLEKGADQKEAIVCCGKHLVKFMTETKSTKGYGVIHIAKEK